MRSSGAIDSMIVARPSSSRDHRERVLVERFGRCDHDRAPADAEQRHRLELVGVVRRQQALDLAIGAIEVARERGRQVLLEPERVGQRVEVDVAELDDSSCRAARPT